MADTKEDNSREDLTEEASPYRIEEYRQKGIVAQSKELTALVALLATAVVIDVYAPSLLNQLGEFMRDVFRMDLSSRMDLGSPGVMRGYLTQALRTLVSVSLPICGAGFVLGVFGSLVQIGAIFSLEPMAPDFSKINPVLGLGRLFSLRQAIDGLRLILKMTAILVASYFLVKTQVILSPQHIYKEPLSIMSAYANCGKSIFIALFSILIIFGGIDLIIQRLEYNKNLRMTKQESKQEHKEREGDPQIRARIRSIQREMARKRMMQSVKKADVIVTNPTHIAVAIVYEKASMAAPKVVAKGADFLAQRIKEIGASAGVPLVENVPLARTLFKTVKVGQAVPKALYQAVAEVLAYVYRLRSKKL